MDIVLVHGTTQSPSGWLRLVRELELIGHRCVVVDLGADDAHSSSSEFAAAVADQAVVRDPMVVAHSGSGLLLGAICSALDARCQVFLAAIVPDGVHSLTEELRQHAAEMFDPGWIGVDPVADHDAARRFLFHDCDDETTEWAMTTLRSFHPAAVYDEVVPVDTTRPTAVVVPVEDRTIRPEWMRRTAQQRLGVTAVEIGGGHFPHVAAPALVTAALDEFASG